MTRFIARLACAFLFASCAQGLNLGAIARSYDGVGYQEYPNGDKPQSMGTCPPAGWAEANIGDGGGQVCDDSDDWLLSVSGTTMRQNAHLVYKDAGSADVQFSATVADDYAGASGVNAGVGIGLRDSASSAAYLFQIHVLNAASPLVECTYGSDGTYTTVSGVVGQLRPIDLVVTYDLSATELRAFSEGIEVCRVTKSMSDVIAYAVGQSKSTAATLTATLEDPTLTDTITAYTPDPPPPGAPTLVSPIPDQSGTQGVAFTFDWRSYFSGATSYELGSAMPGALTESSDGVLSGTPNATDVSSSPYSRDLCGRNASGVTCDAVTFTFSPVSGNGSVFTVPDVADVKSTFDCSISGGANGSTWTSVRTSGSNTRPQAGDTILITSASRGAVEFKNCHGNASSPITIAKTASATRLTITGTGGGNDALLCRSCTYVTIDGLLNWTGHSSGCGADSARSETPLTDCGILVDTSGQFAIKFRGQSFGNTVRGIEADGNWPVNESVTGAQTALSTNDKSYCVVPGTEWREDFVFENNYFHHFAAEIVYVGDNLNDNCSNPNEDWTYLRDITLRNNYMRYAGWDGVNIKSAYTGTNVMEGNVVLDIGGGVAASGANSVGLSFFESEGIVRYNRVGRTSDPPGGAAGINCSANKAPASFGTLDCQVYGNLIHDTDGAGVLINRGANADANRSATIYNNTIVDTGAQAISICASCDGGGAVRNNLISDPGGGGATGINISGSGYTNSNNRTCAVGSCGFVDDDSDGNQNDNDYSLTSGSPARNAGGSSCPSEDIIGTVRPKGSACDQGAYEFVE